MLSYHRDAMNPANFQNMAGPPPGSRGMQQQAGPQQNIRVQQLIYRTLQQQQTPPGWQTAFPLEKRTAVVWQLVTSLRLIKPDMDVQQSINVAVTFEQKTFYESHDQRSYEQTSHQKLKDITDTRSKQARNNQQQFHNPQHAQMNMTPQPMQMQGMVQNQHQGHLQPVFPNAQLQQAMQMQQQLSHQPQPQMLNPQSSLQPAQNQHPSQPHVAQQNGQAMFTAEEQQQINRMAQIMAQKTSKEQLDLIQNRLRTMNPEMRQNLAMQNIDPLTYYFRSQATSKYMTQKAQHAAQRNQGTGTPGLGSLPQQPRPTPQSSGTQATVAPPPQNFDSTQIHVQQQNALRSQEAGQVVVPASNSQAIVEQQIGSGRGNAQQPNGQVNGVRPMQNTTQPYYPPQSNTQQGHAMAMQPQTGNFGNMANQGPQHNLQGQPNGLNMSGRTPQQNPSMPNLNRAFGSPDLQAQAVAMWPQQRPQANPQKDQNQMNPQQVIQASGQVERLDAGQQRPRPPILSLPPELHRRLANMPEDQRNTMIAQLHNRQRQHVMQQQQQQRAMQQANTRAQGLPDSTIMQDQADAPGTHFTGTQLGPTIASQPANVQSGFRLQHPAMVQPPVRQYTMPPQRQQQHQQPNVNLVDQQRAAQVANSALTDEQARQMDRQNFPPGILNITGALSTLPKDVKTWGQLKSWVAENQTTLPPGTLIKLRGLQGIHYQNLKMRQMGPNPPVQAQAQGTSQPPAPPAQMVAPPNNQTPLAGSNTPRVSTPNIMHSLPQPTVQEIQASRARHSDHMKGMTDEQIRGLILKQRQNDMVKVAQGHPGVTPQQQAQFLQLQRAQQQPAQQIQFQTPVNPKTQSVQPQPTVHPSPRPGALSKASGAKQGPAARAMPPTSKAGQPNQKGIKRNSNDDVIEVPNPNLATPAARTQPPNTSQASQQPKSGPSQNINVQGQRAQLDAQRQMVPQQASGPALGQQQSQGVKPNGPMDAGPQRTEEQMRKDAQLHRIYTEVVQATPRGRPVTMAPQIRQRMVRLLQETTKIVSRIPNALPIFFGLIADEHTFRDLIRTHLLVSHQYRDKMYENPAENFTISLDELDAAMKKLNKYFAWLLSQINPRKGNQGVQMPGQSQNRAPTTQQSQPQPPREEMPMLNAANLQHHQLALQHARAANLQRNHNNTGMAMQKTLSNNSSRTPAAPTSTQPPFPFGGQPPHGVPRAYAERPNELTQDQLIIPSAKRRKGNQAPSAGSTPVLTQGTPAARPSPQVTRVEIPEVQRMPPASVSLKCIDPDCAMSSEEFAAQADLDTHQRRIHPNFNDPLEFCLESIRMGLNLDGNGNSKSRPETAKVDNPGASEAMHTKQSVSTHGQTMVKQETATPMTRVPTQTGPSPAANLLKTPQATNVKTPASDVKPASKDGKAVDPKASQAASKTAAPVTEDPWAGSGIPASVISSAFSGLSDLQSLGPWNKIQSTLTPDSTLSSGNTEKNSPHPSDISENDAVNININVDEANWMPSEWFTDEIGGIEVLNMDQELDGMDWNFDDAVAAEPRKVKKGKEKRDEWAPSSEWLKLWAPDQL